MGFTARRGQALGLDDRREQRAIEDSAALGAALGKPSGGVGCPISVGVGLTSDDLRLFYNTHYGRVLGVVTLVTGSRAGAEDVVHEALARAWERGGGLERLDRWVLTVALNLARNRWRKIRREVGGVAIDRPVPAEDGQAVDLARALHDLPGRQREVVVLYYLLDLPVGEVAELLGLSAGGVKHALFRARRSLASALAVVDEEVT